MKKPSKITQSLVTLRYGKPSEKIDVIVVAGRAGKTTTCHLIKHLLEESGEKVFLLSHHMSADSPWKDYSSSISALQKALSFAVRARYRYAIVEADEDMAHILNGTTFVVNTLVGLSDESYIRDLARTSAFAVVPYGVTLPELDTHHVMTFGEDEKAEMRIEAVRQFKKGTEISLRVDYNQTLEIATYLMGTLNARNVAAALATMYILSVDTQHFANGVAELEEVPGNYTYIETTAPYNVAIDRGYTRSAVHEHAAMAKALSKRRLILVVEDTYDSETEEMLINTSDRVIATGDTSDSRITPASSPDEAVALAFRTARQGDVILFLGDVFLQKQNNGRTVVEELIA